MRKMLLALGATVGALHPSAVLAQDNILGEVRWFAGSYCPKNWSTANGQIMGISQNSAVFSLMVIDFGGNGSTTFALPDLRGRTVVGAGSAPGNSVYDVGQAEGVEYSVVPYAGLPGNVVTASPTPVAVAKAETGADPATTVSVPGQSGVTGSNVAHENRQPYLAMQPCVAMSGIYPPRD